MVEVNDGGVQYVPQIAVQYVYLDFDGELTSYNGEFLTVDNVEVQDSSLPEERITDIVRELNARYADQNVVFVTERPETAEYSTIYIGKTEAFSPYGNFAGLAETIDKGNKISTDKAFVMMDSTASNERIIEVISHETDHLLGTLNHGGSDLSAYAASTIIGSGVSSTGLTISSGDSLCVLAGGKADHITVTPQGTLHIYSGGLVSGATISGNRNISYSSGGCLFVFEGGNAINVTLCSSGRLGGFSFEEDKFFADIVNGSAIVGSQAYIVGSQLLVASGGIISNTTVHASSIMNVFSGGTAIATTVNSSGCLNISGGTVQSTSVNFGADMFVFSGGLATDTVVSSRGYLCISQYGVVSNTTLVSNGQMNVYRGGSANQTFIDYLGSMNVFGGIANSTTIDMGGHMTISHGGLAFYITVSQGGGMSVSSSVVNNLTIHNSGDVNIFNGGLIENIFIKSGARTSVFSGGTACKTTVSSGGILRILSGGGVQGNLQISSGASVTVDSGANINFNLVGRNSTVGYLINDISLISGTPIYTITVSANQASGIYKLAQGAAGFNKSIYIGNESVFGILNVNGSDLKYNGISYSLLQNSGDLTLTVKDITPPEAPQAAADITAATNQDVTVSATFSSDTVKKEYSLDNQNWETYTSTGVVMTDNGMVYFRGTDEAGNVSLVTTFEVSNIDKTSPEKPVASADITAVTNQDVTVSATFSSDTVKKEYSLDNRTWKTYTSAGVVMTDNGMVYFRGTDAVGNVSQVTSFEVSNIDRVAPSKPTVQADFTEITNFDVTVTATFSGDSFRKQYSLDNRTWLTYTSAGVVMSDNGMVYFRGIDEAGNISQVTSYEVTNIDKVAPSKPRVAVDVTEMTNGDVTVTATFSGDSFRKQYSFDNRSWQTYTSAGVLVTDNGMVYFRGIDEAGNISQVTSYEVTNIDRIAPGKPVVQADITEMTNGDVTVIATFSSDSFRKQYSFDNRSWQTYTSAGVVMTDNGMVYFRGTDEAGNVSQVASYEVTNIDKTAPEAPAAVLSTETVTNGDVAVTVTYSADSVVREYKIGDGEWLDYIGEITVSENGTVYFRAKDAVGNESIGEITVSNIDKVAPEIPSEFTETVSGYDAAFTWTDSVDNAGMSGYCFRYGSTENLDGEGEFVSTNGFTLNDLAVGSYYYQVRGVDLAGNMSEWSAVRAFAVIPGEVQDLSGSIDGLSWASIAGVGSYAIELTGGSGSLDFETANTAIDFFALPAGTFQWQVKAENGVFTAGNAIVSENSSEPQLLSSEANGDMDLFFGNASGTWEDGYFAEHQGILNGWNGTGEQVELLGKNKISDVFSGSDDANILVLTDDANGDALFVEDVYTSFGKDAARIAQIDEIRAGAGDDIIDLTSQKFAYDGDGVKIYGGLGNDTIWANNSNNTLFGDAGNDRIIGGSGNDVIVGGIGNDSMHGGGGEDIFSFGSDWGVDTVEQLSDGKVTLWFADGEVSNWNADTLTYTDGANSVTVSGVSAENITLNFGNETSLPAGAFSDAACAKIFEDKKQGMLA